MVKARKYVVVRPYQGLPQRTDFEIVEEELPPLKDGEILAEAEYISVDPYMRSHAKRMTTPYDQFGFQVAKVVESRDPQVAVGSRVASHAGWRDLTILNLKQEIPPGGLPYILPDLGTLSNSHGIGAVGMPGATAYFGFLNICQPKAGDTVVVTGAAGAVGSLVGQIAKIKGCKVIGIAGSDAKVKILNEEYGFDVGINYKSADIAEALKRAAPNGVDCYFDNVGGEQSSIILSQMNQFGRVAVCGSISSYNDSLTNLHKATIIQPSLVFKQLRVEGFQVWRWWHSEARAAAFAELSRWVREGRLHAREHVTEGFDKLYDAFVGMLRGENVGKALVKV